MIVLYSVWDIVVFLVPFIDIWWTEVHTKTRISGDRHVNANICISCDVVKNIDITCDEFLEHANNALALNL